MLESKSRGKPRASALTGVSFALTASWASTGRCVLLRVVGQPTTLERVNYEPSTLTCRQSKLTLRIFRGQVCNGTVGTLTQGCTLRPSSERGYVSPKTIFCQGLVTYPN